MIMGRPKLFKIQTHTDTRGTIKYANEFTFRNVKRFYHIVLREKNMIRAFHGHMIEEKFIYVIRGTLRVVLVPLSDSSSPSKEVQTEAFTLNTQSPQILHIPSQYANGIMSLEENTEVLFYSTLLLEDSLKDDYRFDENYWGKNVWGK